MDDLEHFMVRGSPLMADLEYIRIRYGNAGEEQLLSSLPTEYADICRQGLSAHSWYSMTFRMAILDAINKLYAKDDMDYFWEIGSFQAKHNISNFYRAFVQVFGTEATMKLGKMYWRLIYQTSYIKLDSSRNRLQVEVFEYPKVNEHNCHVIRGYIHGTLELAGEEKADLTGSEPTCINRGDERCRFVYTWS